MFRFDADLQIYLHREPIDFRAGINSLVTLVEQSMQLDPLARAVFAFHNRKRDRVKLLLYDRAGFWLLLKRFESGSLADLAAIAQRGISLAELTTSLEGIDVGVRRRVRAVNATVVA
ncbi:IS66 family insertion sequence element accessory protein TnpB [Trinickia soli]|nr:IS66 family insertion sequence element accessory protein TnpB [Trinickia soli]CAB3698542.1 IS66 family transposase IS1313 [Trinickia soli]